MGDDPVLPVPVGPQLPQPEGARSHDGQRDAPGQPRCRGVPHRRRAVHLEAAWHQLPQPAAGPHHRAHAAHHFGMRLPGRGA